MSEIARDFDEIADAVGQLPAPERLSSAERSLLGQLPRDARTALDVGCGAGVLSRELARRGLSILAIDLSPRMIEVARLRTPPLVPVEFRIADIMQDALGDRTFDVVVSANVVHHLPLRAVVPRLTSAVRPGGTLLLQDVVTRDGLLDFPLNVVAAISNRLRRSRSRTSSIDALYERHGAGERYLRPREVDSAYRELLPGARVLHHLEWRYSVVWRRPDQGRP